MRIINKNNKKIYVYTRFKKPTSILISNILFIVSIILFAISVFISVIYDANAPMIVGGIALSSLFFNICSMIFSLSELYYSNSYTKYFRNIFLLQLLYLIIWAFIM